jgi:hypothetical protein
MMSEALWKEANGAETPTRSDLKRHSAAELEMRREIADFA